MDKITAIVPAAGFGRRFGAGENKPLYELLGKPLVVWTLQALQGVGEIRDIVLVVKVEDLKAAADLIEYYKITKVRRIVPGGDERQDSVYNGINALDRDTSVVVIHDGARPLAGSALIQRTISGLQGVDGVVAGVPVKDTIKEVRHGDTVGKTLDRQTLRSIQTPQTFHAGIIRTAHQKAHAEGFYATDDAALVEHYGGSIRIVEGSYLNLKITTLEDIYIAEALYLKSCV